MTASSNGVEESRDFDLRRLTIDFHLLIFLFHEIDAAKSLLVMRKILFTNRDRNFDCVKIRIRQRSFFVNWKRLEKKAWRSLRVMQ